MMVRNRSTPGIILSSRRVGEYHKALQILSPEEGIFFATAFGALKGKSRLAGVTEPFTEGRMYLYHNPVKDSIKLSEVDAVDTHEGLRTHLKRYYIASFWVECVIKSFAGGGEFSSLYRLLSGALAALERTERFDAITVHFVWRYLDVIGFRPEIEVCENCAGVVDEEETMYLEGSSFLCGNCAAVEQHLLSPWARRFLGYSASSPFSGVERFLNEAPVSGNSGHGKGRELNELKQTILRLVQDVVERPLNTLLQGML